LFDDVDDFHCLRMSGEALSNTLNESLAASYAQYEVAVSVSYAGSELGVANNLMKRIDITVTNPTGESIAFRSYQGNW
jgi:MSHA pilin protein MshD